MNVPFGNLKDHYQSYKAAIDEAVQRVLNSGYFVLGPELVKFEKDLEELLTAGYAAGVASGTDALYLALVACDVGAGDEVLVVAHTAVPTICAIRMTGATPVFVDICAQTYTMDPEDLSKKITPRTKAIVPVHLYGQSADMDPILALAAKHGLKIVEDCAQSIGATYKGRQTGSMGDFGALSFYPSKNLGAFGDGGAVVTKSRENYDRLMMLRNYGQSKRYYHDTEGINSRLDEIQAAILSSQVPFLKEWNERRREIAQRYTDGLKDVVVTPVEREGNYHVYHLYVIQSEQREELIAYLLERSVQALIHYPVPAHLQRAFEYLSYKPGTLPVTEHVTRRIVSLPIYPGLTDEQIDTVIEAVRAFHKEQKETQNDQGLSKNVSEKPYEVAANASTAK